MAKDVVVILEPLPLQTIQSFCKETLQAIDSNDSVDEEYCCARCETGKFPTKSHLREHLRFTHEIYEDNNLTPMSYECDKCDKVYQQICFFNEHWLLHQPPKLSCTECTTKFRKIKCLREHLQKQHNIVEKRKLHSCGECGKTFRSAYYLDYHAAYHKPPQLSCEDCGKKFFLWRNLQGHISHAHRGKTHHNQKGKNAHFTCSVCQKHFANAKSLHTHSLVHKAKQFKCSMCEAEFVQPHLLDQHLSSVHSITAPKEHKCDICGRQFSTRHGLYSHKKYHSSPTVACSLCDLTFYNNSTLATHKKSNHSSKWQMPIKLSTREPSYTCAVCCRPFGLNLVGRTKLRAHLCIHYQKPVECHICQRIFNSKESLTKHLSRTHNFVSKKSVKSEK